MQSLLFSDKTQRENYTDSKNPDGVTQNQHQSLSVPLARQSVNRTHLSTDSNTPKIIIINSIIFFNNNTILLCLLHINIVMMRPINRNFIQ